MSINNSLQALAQELIEELNDKKPKVFGMYCKIIKKHGERKVRQILSEVKDSYATGKIKNKVKVFMFKIKQLQNNDKNSKNR